MCTAQRVLDWPLPRDLKSTSKLKKGSSPLPLLGWVPASALAAGHLPWPTTSLQGKKLPASISEDAEEGEVSDEDSADEIDEDCKLLNGDVSRAGRSFWGRRGVAAPSSRLLALLGGGRWPRGGTGMLRGCFAQWLDCWAYARLEGVPFPT